MVYRKLSNLYVFLRGGWWAHGGGVGVEGVTDAPAIGLPRDDSGTCLPAGGRRAPCTDVICFFESKLRVYR